MVSGCVEMAFFAGRAVLESCFIVRSCYILRDPWAGVGWFVKNGTRGCLVG
jgi:hypothetical protein